MRKSLFIFALLLSLVACDKKTKTEKAIDEIPVELNIVRFDKLFFETEPKDLDKLKAEFPFFFPPANDDSVWLSKMKDPLWRELYTEVQKKYADFEPKKTELTALFKQIKFHFPTSKTPKVVTIISEMDYNNKVIYTDSLVVIALELYLGKDHRFYQFPKYLKQNFEERQMLPDVVASFSKQKIPTNPERNLLSQMIFSGKELYLKDILLPDYTDAEKIGYTPEQIAWCEENETYIWRYFLENEILYSDEQKLDNRFINPAPFSKFYVEIDNESSGRVGTWIGWQMLRSFAKNNDVPLEQLLKMSTKEIFEKSKYKPKKNVE